MKTVGRDRLRVGVSGNPQNVEGPRNLEDLEDPEDPENVTHAEQREDVEESTCFAPAVLLGCGGLAAEIAQLVRTSAGIMAVLDHKERYLAASPAWVACYFAEGTP